MSWCLEGCLTAGNWWTEKAPYDTHVWSEVITPFVGSSTEVVAQVLASVAPCGAGELAITAIGVSGQTISLTLTSGQPRRIYTIQFLVTMSNGQVYDMTLNIRVRPLQWADQPQVAPVSGFGTPVIWPPYYSGMLASQAWLEVVNTFDWPASDTGLNPGQVFLNGSLVGIVPGAGSVPAQPLFFGMLRSTDLLALGATPLPLYDPQVSNQLWQNSSIVAISQGSYTGLAANGSVLTVIDTTGWPTSSSGLNPGQLWLNGNAANMVLGATYSGTAPVFLGFISSAELLAFTGAILPITDPGVAGQLWANGTVLNISAG